jgi:hypothetical protein
MYQYYQPNPLHKNGKGDCTVRAISKALNMSWDTAYIELVMQGYLLKDMPSSNEVMNSYLRSKGFSKHAIPDICPDCYSFEDFANDHPQGTYVIGTGTHVACIKDGTIFDSWNSSDCVGIYFYRKENDLW